MYFDLAMTLIGFAAVAIAISQMMQLKKIAKEIDKQG